jgi:hypothetical protein
MRLPRIRFTIRWMLVAVAVIAVGMGIVMTWRKQTFQLSQAERYLNYQEQDQTLLDGYKSTAWTAGYRGQSKDQSVRQGRSDQYWRDEAITAELGVVYSYRLLAYHRQMAGKHLRAAARPWETVSPDPAPPNWPDRKESTTLLLMEMDKKATQPVAPVSTTSSP